MQSSYDFTHEKQEASSWDSFCSETGCCFVSDSSSSFLNSLLRSD